MWVRAGAIRGARCRELLDRIERDGALGPDD